MSICPQLLRFLRRSTPRTTRAFRESTQPETPMRCSGPVSRFLGFSLRAGCHRAAHAPIGRALGGATAARMVHQSYLAGIPVVKTEGDTITVDSLNVSSCPA